MDKTKKKPGRPPKTIKRNNVPRLGIMEAPSNAGEDPQLVNVMEMVYDNPAMFKKIFLLFRAMNVESIRARFETDGIKMMARDHPDKNYIHLHIFGDRLNSYYCEKVLEIGLGANEIERILQTLTKDYYKIIWCTNRQYERSRMNIILVNDEMGEESNYNVDVYGLEEYDWNIEERLSREEDYAIKFELPSKYLKKKVNDFKLLGDIMRIEKNGEDPLRLSYNFTTGRGNCDNYLRDSAKINLRSTIDPEDIFSVSICLDHIKPLSGALLADSIQIAAQIGEAVIFTSLLDQDETGDKHKIIGTERCQIKVITETARGESAEI